MLTVYHSENGKIISTMHSSGEQASLPVWIDLLHPTAEEERQVESLLGIEIPTRDEMHEIEPSSRLYQHNGAVYLTAMITTKSETPEPESHAVSFVLCDDSLVTVRYSEPLSFKIFTDWVLKGESGVYRTGTDVLSGLLEAVIDRMADVLDLIGHQLDDMAKRLFRPSITDKEGRAACKPDFEEMLRQIAIQGDRISKARESLVNLQRLLGFVSQTHFFPADSELFMHAQIMLKDIPALSDHASFLSNKVSFLLDATLGMVSLEQNAIIKIFSVAAVVFLPPTLVASLYGMNFQHMPELQWAYGYPFAIVLMLISAYLPYRFFKGKGWL